jgi:molybdopterin-binding protein
MEARAIKALSEQQVADLKAGRGMGLALAAELNGYPGPIHAIELADKLGLSSDQVARLRKLFEAMKAETIPLGMQLIAAERSLDDAFAGRTITLASLESETQSIGAIQARLRAAHLKYHLAAVAVLTPEQVEKYTRSCAGTRAERRNIPTCTSRAGSVGDRPASQMEDPMKLSARNILKGTVVEVKKGQTTSHVRLDLGGGNVVTASITNESVDDLKLQKGQSAYAIIKATSVMIGVD